MRIRSTGLGETEMVLGIKDITRVNDCLILQGQSSAPVKWKIRMAASYRDMWNIVRLLLFSKNIFFLLWKTLGFKSEKDIAWPENF